VINESGYTIGDDFPEVRGLMHIKNELEQQVFKEDRANIVVALWSTQCKDLNGFLEVIDNLAHEKKVKAAYAINVDRVFLYNEAV
jgi:thioredoxin-like negative regulator of GroEL